MKLCARAAQPTLLMAVFGLALIGTACAVATTTCSAARTRPGFRRYQGPQSRPDRARS